jgi:hypothetical protein
VVIYYLDFDRAFRRPNKAHPELVVDPDRVLPLAIARQGLKTIAWRRPQVAKIARGVKVAQFPARNLDKIGRKALRAFAVEDRFGSLVAEAPDHREYVSFNDTAVKIRVSINDTDAIGPVMLHFVAFRNRPTPPISQILIRSRSGGLGIQAGHDTDMVVDRGRKRAVGDQHDGPIGEPAVDLQGGLPGPIEQCLGGSGFVGIEPLGGGQQREKGQRRPPCASALGQ